MLTEGGWPSRWRPGTPAAIHETRPIRSSSAIITAEKILLLILRFRISPSGSFWRITLRTASAIGPYGERARPEKGEAAKRRLPIGAFLNAKTLAVGGDVA
jgi:hypothetical protein